MSGGKVGNENNVEPLEYFRKREAEGDREESMMYFATEDHGDRRRKSGLQSLKFRIL